jgi:probable phosphoglycerate mutase
VGRLQGQTDTPLNATGRRQGVASGQILRKLLARDGRTTSSLTFVASPLARARDTMELALAPLAAGCRNIEAGRPTATDADAAYGTDVRLKELTFGAWEGFTLTEIAARDPGLIAARERDKWHFVPPGGESYEQLCARVRDWYGTLAGDTVAVAHGGTFRVLRVILGLTTRRAAPAESVRQGAVYRFAPDGMTCYQ